MANRPLMVRAVRTIVMQMLIISLIKALEGGKRGEGVELTLIELHVLTPTRQEFSRPAQTGYLGLGGRRGLASVWSAGDWGWVFQSVTQGFHIYL